MTELLKDSLRQQADTLSPATPDLSAILADGRSRVRRRRAFGGVVAAAALVGAAIIVPAQLGGWGTKDDAANVAASDATQLSWAEGSVIHVGGDRIDVGREIYAYVESGWGYVFTDVKGTVFQWEDGKVLTVGKVQPDSARVDLVSDGSTVTWLDVTDGTWSFAVSERTGVVRRLPVEISDEVAVGGKELSPQQQLARARVGVLALDQRTLYARDSRGSLAFDLRSGEVTVLSQEPELTINDVEGGTLLFTDEGGPITELGRTYAAASLTENRGTPLAVDGGDLAPGGRYVMSENSATSSDDFVVVALEESVYFTPPEKEEYDFFAGYAWIDGDRYLAFGLDRRSGDGWTTEAMTCSAAQRSCGEPVTLPDLPDLEREPGFQLPIGQHLR